MRGHLQAQRHPAAQLHRRQDREPHDALLLQVHALPRPYLKSKFPYIASEVNKRLGAEAAPEPFIVQITASRLNVRKGPGTSYAVAQTVSKGQSFTIVQQQGGWGKLKSGAGWISLKYTARK